MTLPLLAGRWITGQHWQQFRAEGYMVVRDVVPASLTGKAVRDIAAFVGADLADSTTWYSGEQQLDGVVPMHHAQSLWDIRQCQSLPGLHGVLWSRAADGGYQQVYISPSGPSGPSRHQLRKYSLGHRPEIWGGVCAGSRLVDRCWPR